MAAHPGSPALVNTRQRAARNTNTSASHTTIITIATAPPAALLVVVVSWKNMNASWVIAFLLLDQIWMGAPYAKRGRSATRLRVGLLPLAPATPDFSPACG